MHSGIKRDPATLVKFRKWTHLFFYVAFILLQCIKCHELLEAIKKVPHLHCLSHPIDTMSYNHKNHIKVTFVPKVYSVLVFSWNLKVTSIHFLMNWFVWCGLNFITMHEQSMNKIKCHKLSVPGRTCYDEKYDVDVRLRWKFKWHRVAHRTFQPSTKIAFNTQNKQNCLVKLNFSFYIGLW